MKKVITIEYETPIEFVARYARKDLELEREELEKVAKIPYMDILAVLATNDEPEILTDAFMEFAPQVGFEFCPEHDIFHEYGECPFCQLGIRP